MKNNIFRLFALLAIVLAFAKESSAFTYIVNSDTKLPIKWPAGAVTLRVALGSTPTLSDGTNYNNSFVAACQSWNDILGSAQLQPQIVGSPTAGDGNRVNEIIFSSTVHGRAFGTNVLAVTTTWSIGNERDEGDIIFNTAWTWNSYRGPTIPGVIDIRRVAIHELGHLLGLDHPDEAGQSVSAIMNSRVSNIDGLTSDDINGGQSLYGPPGVPANDNFASAVSIFPSNNAAQVAGFNTNTTKEGGEPNHAGNAGGRSAWWRWTAPGAGRVDLNTQGSVFDTTLGVYTGAAVSALTTIASNDDLNPGITQYSILNFNATAGTTYYFAVDGFDADSGSVRLNFNFTPPPAITTQPTSQTATVGGSASFTVAASGDSLSYQWFFNGSAIGGATSANLSLANTQTANAGAYHVVVTNNVGSTSSNTVNLTVLSAQVQSQTVTNGRDVSFSAPTISGYRWQVSTDGGASWSNLSNGGVYSGVTTNTLTISGATSAMNGYQYRYASSGGTAATNPATLTVAPAFFPFPTSIAIDSAGNLYVGDASARTIQKISPTGVVTALAGSTGLSGSTDGVGTAARFNQPNGLAITSAGILFAADTPNNTIRRIAVDGTVTTFAGSVSTSGNADNTTATLATFSSPVGLAFDSAGNLYIADSMNHTIRRISTAAAVTTFAGSAGASGTANGVGTAARFNFPNGAAVDATGNLYIADTTNNTIRKIVISTATSSTLAGLEGVSGSQNGSGPAALFNQPTGLAVDSTGNIYVADTGNSIIRKVTPAGAVTTLAGLPGVAGLKDGTGSEAWFNQPKALALDSSGNVFVADTGNAALRKITPAGAVTTIALSTSGGGSSSSSSSGGGAPVVAPPAASGGGGGGGGAFAPWFASLLAVALTLRLWAPAKPR